MGMNSTGKTIQLEKNVNMRIICARYAHARHFPIFLLINKLQQVKKFKIVTVNPPPLNRRCAHSPLIEF